jgi:hypothetical protein
MIEAYPRDTAPATSVRAGVTALVEFLVGPVICRDGGYAFATCSILTGLKRGFLYRRVEQANYDRKMTLGGGHLPAGHAALACDTAAEFAARCGAIGFMAEAALAN